MFSIHWKFVMFNTVRPTVELSCQCESGTWHCNCLCYGGRSTCPVDPCTLSPQEIMGASCGEQGLVCNYAGNVKCTCDGVFTCQ